jgi:flavin-dependent dehydrogenase
MHAEVAIIGGGLAGSVMAALLARRGVSVALVERDHFPRDKVCGEFLSYDSLPILDRMGLLGPIDEAGASRLRRCRIIGEHRTLEFEFPHEARGISRRTLDELLFRAAGAAGARLIEGATVTEIDAQSLTLIHDEERETLTADVLVGAWGRWGRFDTQFGRAFVRDRSHRHFGFKRHYRRIDASTSDSTDLLSFDRGYLGINDVEGGQTNVCGLVHADRLSGHRGRWQAFVERVSAETPAVARMLASFEPAQDDFLTSEPVIFRPKSPVERGIFLLGDASGIIDPLTGNGMAMAIQSALLAAPFVVASLRDRAGAEDGYRSAHASFFRPRLRWSRLVAPMLTSPRLLRAALPIAPSAVGRMFLQRTRARAESVQALCDAWFA